jgi:hypothetical protein
MAGRDKNDRTNSRTFCQQNRIAFSLSDRAFNQVLRHEISACTWDAAMKVVTSPQAQIEMATIAEFEQQDWVQ